MISNTLHKHSSTHTKLCPHLTDGSRAHGEKREEDLSLDDAVEGAELVRDDRQLLVIPGQIRAGPAVLAL